MKKRELNNVRVRKEKGGWTVTVNGKPVLRQAKRCTACEEAMKHRRKATL